MPLREYIDIILFNKYLRKHYLVTGVAFILLTILYLAVYIYAYIWYATIIGSYLLSESRVLLHELVYGIGSVALTYAAIATLFISAHLYYTYKLVKYFKKTIRWILNRSPEEKRGFNEIINIGAVKKNYGIIHKLPLLTAASAITALVLSYPASILLPYMVIESWIYVRELSLYASLYAILAGLIILSTLLFAGSLLSFYLLIRRIYGFRKALITGAVYYVSMITWIILLLFLFISHNFYLVIYTGLTVLALWVTVLILCINLYREIVVANEKIIMVSRNISVGKEVGQGII